MKPICERIFGFNPYDGFDPEWAEPDLQGWGSEHGIFSNSIKKAKPKLIIEVGTWKGASAIHMGKLCRDLGYDAEIVCVDTWLGSASNFVNAGSESQIQRFDSMRFVNGYPMLYYTFMRNVVDAGLQGTITPLPQTSEHGAKVLRHYRAKADIVYLDAAREKDPLLWDFLWYWPILRKGGLMVGNDYKNPQVQEGVKAFGEQMGVTPEVFGGKYRFAKP